MPIKEPKNPTKLGKIIEILQETERFLKRLDALEFELRMDKDSGSKYFTRTSLSAAVKRSGMDLRRALAELRFFGLWS